MRWLLVFAFLLIFAAPALADTASGIAAYNRGDYATALQELKPAAEKGDAAAQAKYGLMLVKGQGVSQNVPEAVTWFRKSAEQGHAEGQYMLGSAYDVGDTGSVDRVMAVQWYRKSAEQGFAKAQFNLGDILVKGDGVPEQSVEGADWVRKAAEQDHPGAARLYGRLQTVGVGVEQNVLAARYWLTRAQELGQDKAAADLQKLSKSIAEIEADGVPRTAGGDGVTPARAISLPDVTNTKDGVRAEHIVVAAYFKDWTWHAQGLDTRTGPGVYDRIELRGPDGKSKTIYFDISNWFGKLE